VKVLMLGWEFPPHISGGLGTACKGLSEGLALQGVDVLFVVPRAHGDERGEGVEVRGCEGPPERCAPESASPASLHDVPPRPRPDAAEPSPSEPARAPPGQEGRVSVLAVPSALRPYLTEETYRALHPLLPGGASPHPVAPPADARGWDRLVDDVVRAAAEPPLPGPSPPPAFGGGYGAGLLDEVARFALASVRLAADVDFDVVHAHDWMTFPAGVAVARSSGKPLVVQVHASEYDRSGEHVNERVRDIEQMGLDAADRVIAVSRYTAGVLRRRYGIRDVRIRVVHNAVAQREGRPRREKRIEEPIVLFLGRVTFQKGPEYFLEAAARVVAVLPEVKFVLGGSGDLLPGIIEAAAARGLGRHVHFTGFLRGRDVERMYAMADLCVMPSVSEPFGIAPLEAMTLDVPVIVSRQSGVAEILRNALKVDFWDVDDLADKILAVLTRPALRRHLVRAGRKEVRGLRWDVRGARVKRIYEEVAG
jgi:glycogen(starch) synthase